MGFYRTERRVTQQLKLAGKGLAGDLAAELPKNPASSFMKPLPSFHRELAPGNSATRASSSVEGQRKETSDSEDAFKRQRAVHVLEAAFAQLSHFHPDAYETANVRGLTKWWEDPYIFIFLCMSFAALIAMGVWCIVASYK
ncbi:hypothetical protein BESB_071720 [Besnoitia besnoiti]|uniref:Transmembrane protein n=1 Tax=Besnoitia besnoiti TaxID=94643 RepID=A0A2A9MF71_BESBE|nr:uncharacterized protein BESB_071720 [Besnoitia besnoiti]PFH34020.1 hypothetical protein BESB_071720 [Besnoitia besnoiti]